MISINITDYSDFLMVFLVFFVSIIGVIIISYLVGYLRGNLTRQSYWADGFVNWEDLRKCKYCGQTMTKHEHETHVCKE